MRKFFVYFAFLLTTFASAEGMGDIVEFDASSVLSAGPNIVISWEQLEPVEDTFSTGNANALADASNQSDPVILGVADVFGLSAIANGEKTPGQSPLTHSEYCLIPATLLLMSSFWMGLFQCSIITLQA